MATPVRSVTSSTVTIGFPTRKSEYDDLRIDALLALTEMDRGNTASIPGSPEVSQRYLDTDDDVLFVSFDGVGWSGIAAEKVVVTDSGIIIASPGTLEVLGAGPHSIGVGALDFYRLRLGGAYVSGGASTVAAGVSIDGSLTGADGDTGWLTGMIVNVAISTPDGDNIALVTGLRVPAPAISVGDSGLVITAASVHIPSVPTDGVNNYAIFIGASPSRFDGSILVGDGQVNPGTSTFIADQGGDGIELMGFGIGGVLRLTNDGNLSADERVGLLEFVGNDVTTTESSVAGRFGMFADTDWNNVHPEGMFIWETADGVTASVEKMRLDKFGRLFLGETVNSNAANACITINQGNEGGSELFTLKALGNVDHGMSTITEVDTFFFVEQAIVSTGGAALTGLSEDEIGLALRGGMVNRDTTKSNAAVGAVQVAALQNTGTTWGTVGSNGNLLVIKNFATARFIFDAEGDSHQAVGTAWTNFDIEDDIAVLDSIALELHRSDDPTMVKIRAMDALRPLGRDWLQRHRLVTFNTDGNHFVNRSQMQNLLIGAVRQAGRSHLVLSELVSKLSHQIKDLEVRMPPRSLTCDPAQDFVPSELGGA